MVPGPGLGEFQVRLARWGQDWAEFRLPSFLWIGGHREVRTWGHC